MIKGQERMRRGRVRRVAMAMVMAMTVLAVPAFGQCEFIGGESVCGSVDGFDGNCDGPGTPCNAGSGFIGVFGWALASTDVHRVEILVESVQFPGQVINLGRAGYGDILRPDVTDMFPGFPDSAFPGWSYNINSTLFANGLYDVWAKVVTVGGTTRELHKQQVLITNNDFLLRPFGQIDRPGQNEDIFGTCQEAHCGDGVCEVALRENCLNCPLDCNGQELGLADDFCCGFNGGPNPLACDDPQPPSFPGGDPGSLVCQEDGFICSEERTVRYAVVRGWALDLGMTNEDTGISWVELETNGALAGNTRTGCVFDSRLGGLTNCYGLPRIDLETSHPFAFDAPSAGYRFVLDVGAMLNNNTVTLGSNELIVRAGDWANHFEDIDRVSVNFLCAEDFSEESFGEIESPREGRLYSGLLDLEGWALDGEGIDEVRLYIDGQLVAGTSYGMGLGTRPVVEEDYPGFPDSLAPVFQNLSFDTTTLTNGFHSFTAEVIDDEGDRAFIGGEVIFRVDNSPFALLNLYKPLGPAP